MTVNWTKVLSDVSTVMRQNSFDADFTLRGTGTSFTIKATYIRAAKSGGFALERTQGINQYEHKIKILASDWDQQSPGRRPQKGDLVVIDGDRHRVDFCATAGPNSAHMYNLGLTS